MSMRIDTPDDEFPYGNPRITSLPGMLSVLSWPPDLRSFAKMRIAGLHSFAFHTIRHVNLTGEDFFRLTQRRNVKAQVLGI